MRRFNQLEEKENYRSNRITAENCDVSHANPNKKVKDYYNDELLDNKDCKPSSSMSFHGNENITKSFLQAELDNLDNEIGKHYCLTQIHSKMQQFLIHCVHVIGV